MSHTNGRYLGVLGLCWLPRNFHLPFVPGRKGKCSFIFTSDLYIDKNLKLSAVTFHMKVIANLQVKRR